ncbi:MAG: hypothetical protein DLM70_00905 [Chloroflexi bacterium]|nr:MAG: hypothetical protein DLM70_00905 [Chloroflexota bacterium]
MEDWQEWQQKADKVASQLSEEADNLERQFLSEDGDTTLRNFWPHFRSLKERVRTAPAIRLEAKLALERRLRGLGARAYRLQTEAYARSSERKEELLTAIQELRNRAASEESPQVLRGIRRDLNPIRSSFDAPPPIAPQDRQALWEAWRDASQFVWDRLTGLWVQNESQLREVLASAKEQLSSGHQERVRGTLRQFFATLSTHEAKQDTVRELKSEAEGILREAEQIEDRRSKEQVQVRENAETPLDRWRSQLAKVSETVTQVREEVTGVERELSEARSVLDQSVVRGTLMQKRRKLAEAERAQRDLQQRISSAEDSPMIVAP